MSNFFEKIDKLRTETSSVDDESRVELLLFLKNRIDTLIGRNDLKNLVQDYLHQKVMKSMNPTPLEELLEGEKEEKPIDVNTLIRLLEVLNKADTDESANILGILKQQIMIQQNNFGQPPLLPSGTTTGMDGKEISREEFSKAKRAIDFITKASRIEEG